MRKRNFAIYNAETGALFVTYRGRRVWGAVGHAKNAWLNEQPYISRPKHFDDQTEFVVREVALVPVGDAE